MNLEYATLSTPEIEAMIAELQMLQKRNPPTSETWRDASAALKPLFAEMAERTR